MRYHIAYGTIVVLLLAATAATALPLDGATVEAESSDYDVTVAEPAAAWVSQDPQEALQVFGHPKDLVMVTAQASLAGLSHVWQIGPIELSEEGVRTVPLNIPASAWLDSAAADYVTDLIVVVNINGQATTPGSAFLAWPAGPLELPVVWNQSDEVANAPQGVLRAELRNPALTDADRVVPVLDSASAGAPNVSLTGLESDL